MTRSSWSRACAEFTIAAATPSSNYVNRTDEVFIPSDRQKASKMFDTDDVLPGGSMLHRCGWALAMASI
jgi:hypothetical protein